MSLNARKVAGAIVVERILSFLGETLVWGPMVYVMVVYNPLYSFAVGWVLELLFCLGVFFLQVQTRRRGEDVTQITEIIEFIHEPIPVKDGPIWGKLGRGFSRFTQFLLRVLGIRSYVPMVFFWSVFYIEADYVTILLRKEGEPAWNVIDRVMLPAVTWSIGVWTVFTYLAVEGVQWAIALTGL